MHVRSAAATAHSHHEQRHSGHRVVVLDDEEEEGKSAHQDEDGALTRTNRILRELGRAKHYDELAEPSHWLIDSNPFNITIGVCIGITTLQMGLEADYPDATNVWAVFDNTIAAVFTLEMLIKLAVLRSRYVKDGWNWLDGSLVVLAIIDTWILPMVAADANLLPTSSLRILRLCRMVRVLRLAKPLRQLAIVITGVIDAIKSTFWVAGVLALAIYVGAIFCVHFVGPRAVDVNMYPGYSEDIEAINAQEFLAEFNPYVSFGSVGRSMLTLFNVAILAEWTEVVRPLLMKQPVLLIFFILFVQFITFGIMNVIIGMIVDNVMTNARSLQKEDDQREREEKMNTVKTIQKHVASLDIDGDGFVTVSELEHGLRDMNSPMQKLLAKVDLPIGFSPEELMCMLDTNGDGTLNYEEFVQAIYRMMDAGPFQQTCLLQANINILKRTVNSRLDRFEATLATIAGGLQLLGAGLKAAPPRNGFPNYASTADASPRKPPPEKNSVRTADQSAFGVRREAALAALGEAYAFVWDASAVNEAVGQQIESFEMPESSVVVLRDAEFSLPSGLHRLFEESSRHGAGPNLGCQSVAQSPSDCLPPVPLAAERPLRPLAVRHLGSQGNQTIPLSNCRSLRSQDDLPAGHPYASHRPHADRLSSGVNAPANMQ